MSISKALQGDSHVHKFDKVYKKVIPVRRVFNEAGETKRDTITAHDTIYYRKCASKECKATQPFHLTREEK